MECKFQNDTIIKKINLFLNSLSDPIVLLKLVNFGAELEQNEVVFELARKGNEGLTWDEKHTCYLCRKVLKNRGSLTGHLKNIHGKGPAMFCDLCPSSFHDKSKLMQHMNVHKAKQFACNVCDFRTAYKNGFENHKLRHALKEKCKICNKLVTFLKEHLKLHQPRKECQICKKMVPAYHFTDHIKRHGKWSCKDCGDKFTSKNELKG